MTSIPFLDSLNECEERLRGAEAELLALRPLVLASRAMWDFHTGEVAVPHDADPYGDFEGALIAAESAALSGQAASGSEAAHYWVGNKGVANGGNISLPRQRVMHGYVPNHYEDEPCLADPEFRIPGLCHPGADAAKADPPEPVE